MADPQQFDVFLSYNSKDRQAVRCLGRALKKRELTVWLDEWELPPGCLWQNALEDIIANCKSAAVCVGENGVGPWEEPEMLALIRRFVNEKKKTGITLPVIPVLLPKAPQSIKLPVFLEGFTWVDLSKGLKKAGLDRLQWGITGEDPRAREKRSASVLPFPVKPARIERAETQRLPRRLLGDLKRSMAGGELRDSLIAPIVLAVLSGETELKLASGYNPSWITTGIRLSDEYFVLVRESAGERDWQRDFAQTVTPTLVGAVRSLQRSADAQALAMRLCEAIAARLRLGLIWPDDPDQFNDLANGIYRACLQATELESDAVLAQLKGLTVRGPE